jgi:hypothetical protein
LLEVSEELPASVFKVEVRMETAGLSETFVTTYKTVRCHNTEGHNVANVLQRECTVASGVALNGANQQEKLLLFIEFCL